MNSADKRVRDNTAGGLPLEKVLELVALQFDENTVSLFLKYRDNPLIEWKESIKIFAFAHDMMFED